MQAFHGNQKIKDFYVTRVQTHYIADEIVQGQYWQNGRGCAVGCTLHSETGEHFRYERELGIPHQLAYLQDRLFEGLSNGDAKEFPLAFLTAIPVGADLSLVLPRFVVWLLSDPEHGTMRLCTEKGKQATENVVALYQRVIDGEVVAKKEWCLAADAAYAAAYAANAAYAAANAANAAYAAANAAYAVIAVIAKQNYYRIMSNKLLELLQNAPIGGN